MSPDPYVWTTDTARTRHLQLCVSHYANTSVSRLCTDDEMRTMLPCVDCGRHVRYLAWQRLQAYQVAQWYTATLVAGDWPAWPTGDRA